MSFSPNTSHGGYLLHIRPKDLPQSSFPNYPLTTDFIVQLAQPITCQTNEHIALGLHSLSMPSSYYNVDEYSNQFSFRDDAMPAGIWQLITIPPRNYTVRSLASEIALQLNTVVGGGVSISYDNGNNGFIITHSNNFSVNFDVPNSAHQSIGFSMALYSSSSKILQSINSISLNPYFSVYLHCDLCLAATLDSFGNFTDILERVGCPAPNSVLNHRTSGSGQKFLLSQKNINSFRIRLTFDKSSPVNLRGLYPEVSLQFFIVSGLTRQIIDNPRPKYDSIDIQPEPIQGEGLMDDNNQ